MTLELTEATRNAIDQTNVAPQVALVIDGVDTVFGASTILKYVRIGDAGLLIGNSWRIGGLNAVEEQESLISFGSEGGGTTTKITQNLNLDRGEGSSVSQVQVTLIDKNDRITELITPGEVVTDLLGRKAKLLIGFQGTAYPEDYLVIFRGIISEIDSGAGTVTLQIDHPDQKKRSQTFKKQSTELDGMIDAVVTTITVNATTNFLPPITGPDGFVDPDFNSVIRIDDELIKYTGKTSTTFTGCVRGYLNTVAASHQDEAGVESFYRLEGDAMTVALKLMMSGWAGPYVSNIAITSFEDFESHVVDNAVYFEGLDIAEEYGVVIGDYLTVSGATNGANNFSLREILAVEETSGGSYVVVDGGSLVSELTTSAVASIRSKYDTLPDGLKMAGDEVDVAEHELLRGRFLSAFEYDFYLKDTVDGREFIEKEIYLPAAAFSIPRKSKASVGYTIAPFPGTAIPILSRRTLKNPGKLRLKRSISKNFINTVIYKFDDRPLENEFASATVNLNSAALTQVGIGSRALTIEAKGMRSNLQAISRATSAATRKLNVYKLGAEGLTNIEPMPSEGLPIEIGDTVLVDTRELKISDTSQASRQGFQRLYRVDNKSFDIRTGITNLNLVDTGFDESARYALMSPASVVKASVSTSRITFEPSFSRVFGTNEYRKWHRLTLPAVKIRSPDFLTTYFGSIESWVGNDAIFESPLAGLPDPGWIMEFDEYNNITDEQKFIYGAMSDSAMFDDGKAWYFML